MASTAASLTAMLHHRHLLDCTWAHLSGHCVRRALDPIVPERSNECECSMNIYIYLRFLKGYPSNWPRTMRGRGFIERRGDGGGGGGGGRLCLSRWPGGLIRTHAPELLQPIQPALPRCGSNWQQRHPTLLIFDPGSCPWYLFRKTSRERTKGGRGWKIPRFEPKPESLKSPQGNISGLLNE